MYERLKRLYLAGSLTDVGLDNAAARGWITAEQAAELKLESGV